MHLAGLKCFKVHRFNAMSREIQLVTTFCLYDRCEFVWLVWSMVLSWLGQHQDASVILHILADIFHRWVFINNNNFSINKLVSCQISSLHPSSFGAIQVSSLNDWSTSKWDPLERVDPCLTATNLSFSPQLTNLTTNKNAEIHQGLHPALLPASSP